MSSKHPKSISEMINVEYPTNVSGGFAHLQGFHGKMGFHFAKQKKRILAKTSILLKIPFYPEKPSRLLENFHFALFLEFDQFFACFVLKFEQNLDVRSFRFQNFTSKFRIITRNSTLYSAAIVCATLALFCQGSVWCV